MRSQLEFSKQFLRLRVIMGPKEGYIFFQSWTEARCKCCNTYYCRQYSKIKQYNCIRDYGGKDAVFWRKI